MKKNENEKELAKKLAKKLDKSKQNIIKNITNFYASLNIIIWKKISHKKK